MAGREEERASNLGHSVEDFAKFTALADDVEQLVPLLVGGGVETWF